MRHASQDDGASASVPSMHSRHLVALALLAACKGSPSGSLSGDLGAAEGGPRSDAAVDGDGGQTDGLDGAAPGTEAGDGGSLDGSDVDEADGGERPEQDGGAAPAAQDAEAADAGALDAETVDAGALDAEVADAGALDAEVADAGALDAGEPSDAGTSLVDFEAVSETAMGNSAGVVPPAASRLSVLATPSTSLRFSSGAAYVAVVALGQGHATSGTRGIGGVGTSGALDYSAAIEVRFFTPAGAPATTDLVSIRGDTRPAGGTATMTAFGVDGQALATATRTDASGGLTLEVRSAGIHYVRISESQPNIAFDDLRYGPISAP
jgi:hypothetical protein